MPTMGAHIDKNQCATLQPSQADKQERQAGDGERSAPEDVQHGARVQRAFQLFLAAPGDEEGGLVLALGDQVAVVHVAGLRVLDAGAGDVVL